MKAESRYLTFAIGIVGSSESSHAARTATRLVIEKTGRFVKEANDTRASGTRKQSRGLKQKPGALREKP